MKARIAYPDVTVQLTGEDGNAFTIIGRIARALEKAGHHEAASAFREAALASRSYDALLLLAMRTVDVR